MSDDPDSFPEPLPAPAKPATAIAVAPASKVPVEFQGAPKTYDEAWRVAQAFARSSLVPGPYQGKPDDVLVALQLGASVGLAPMAALQSIAVINGRPSLYGDGLLAIVKASPAYHGIDEYFEVSGARCDRLTAEAWKADDTAAVCVVMRHGEDPLVRKFTVANARRAHLLNKPGPWQEYPDRMLQMRARGFALRDMFADVLRGFHQAEELADIPDAPASTRVVRRLSEREPAAVVVPPEDPADVERR